MTTPGVPVRVALLGCGTVGAQVARLLVDSADDLEARVGRPLELVGIAVRTPGPRAGIDAAMFTTDAAALVARPDLDLVIELMGGIEPARALLVDALASGKSVVTANKALLASHGGELFETAERAGVDLYYEAAVAGAIPIIRPLRESLVGDAVQAVRGIVNGTTNYILDQMHSTGADFATALAEAQELGYAEADPTADVGGADAAAKAAILSSLAFHTRVNLAEVSWEGITEVTVSDIAAAEQLGCVLKLLANCEVSPDGSIAVGVHPTMVPQGHPLAGVHGAFNAVFIESDNAGQLMFMGPGAGGAPTASAVMGDVVTAARNRLRGVAGPGESAYTTPGITDPGAVVSRYYLALVVRDQPGVLARIATEMAAHQVSIQIVRQEQLADDDAHARLGITTHLAPDAAVRAIVATLEAGGDVSGPVRVLRVAGE
ncbi:MAG: homoserine dehydrogenase [Propioniciclava sp.]